jgi:transcriptional regulator with XRE-family HTH domain
MASTENKFAAALRLARRAKNVSQDAMGLLSSRTYVSTLERGLKSPTLNKVEQLSQMLEMHPLTLLVLAYAGSEHEADVNRVMATVASDLEVVRDALSRG